MKGSGMRKHKSDIPAGAREVEIRGLSQTENFMYYRVMECTLDGKLVGQRSYDDEGNLMIETPIKDGKKHGREYIWNETGALESVEPFTNGKRHGLAKQYGRNGNVIGTSRFVHGTGFDIWRWEREDGTAFISEIFSARDGALDGFEWWLNEDQRSVWHERHWQNGYLHGIERMWNERGRLKRGFPKYWIRDQAVRKPVYIRASEKDGTLPSFRQTDNRQQRKFPTEIEQLLG
jgi:hypothetical protein